MATGLTTSDVKIGERYSMSFLASSITGATLDNALLTGIISYDMAETMANVATTHSRVVTQVPTLFTSPAAYQYLVFRKEGGAESVVSTGWITPGSLVAVSERYAIAQVTIKSTEDVTRIRDMLQKAGYKDVSVMATTKPN